MDLDCTTAQCIVRGDVRLTVHHDKLPAPAKVAHLWFHTDFVALNFLAFSKEHIDKANKVGNTLGRLGRGVGPGPTLFTVPPPILPTPI